MRQGVKRGKSTIILVDLLGIPCSLDGELWAIHLVPDLVLATSTDIPRIVASGLKRQVLCHVMVTNRKEQSCVRGCLYGKEQEALESEVGK